MRIRSASTGTPAFVRRRWGRLLTIVVMLALGIVVWLVMKARYDAERHALLRMVPDERRAMYEETLRSAEALCAHAEREAALADRCIGAAEFLLAFPECDATCVEFVRRHQRQPTR